MTCSVTTGSSRVRREVFKRKGESYQLFWPEESHLVRLAVRLNATIVPFSGLGGDESFTIALDSQATTVGCLCIFAHAWGS